MTRWPGHLAVALTALLTFAVAPTTALGQDSSAVPSAAPSTEPEVSQVPSLEPLRALADPGRIQSSQQICDWSGGTLDGTSCTLAREMLVDPTLVEPFGPDVEMMIIEPAGGPVVLSDIALDKGPTIERMTFVPQIPLERSAAKWLNGRQKSKDKSIAKSKPTKWNKLESVGLVSLELSEPINARKLSRGGVFVVSLQDGERELEAGFVDRKPLLSKANGRRTEGMVLFGKDRIDFLLPGGIKGPLSASLVLVDADQRIGGQNVEGPGGSGALIPLGQYPAVLQCASIIADVDPASTTDGNTYGLGGMTITFESPLVPEGIGPVQPTFNLSLAPSGTRANEQIDDIVVEIAPPASEVRRAITLEIDMTAEGFSGPTGYHFGELPYTVTDLSATWTPDDSYDPFDADAAVALLEAAGWADPDGDGTLEVELADVALELNRIAAGNFTSSPINWGWDGCGKDAQWISVQDPCRLPLEGRMRDDLAALLGESPEMLVPVPGSFADGFTGCSLFGEQDAFVGAWLLEMGYGQDPAYDPAILDPFVEIECEVSAEAPAGEGLQLVGSCSEPAMEIFYDNSRGFSSYFAFAGKDLDLDQIAGAIVPPIVDPDLDGDGATDRFDWDIDGDGLANDVDQDDDDDLVFDPQDWAPTDPDGYVSPNSFADQLESLGVGQ
ncbi:MAG: hypothetical protein ACC726_04290 [Chloroflexota bacterium]